jgi:preprotein translocase subunit SecG
MGFYTVLLVAHTILVLFLIMMILLQKTDSDGMSGLGGGGGNQFMTGRSAANFMTRTTAILATCFMITSLALATMASRMSGGSIMDAVPVESPAAVEKAPATTPEDATKQAPPAATPSTPVAPKPE